MPSAFRIPKSTEQGGGEVAVPLSWDTVMKDGPACDAWFASVIERNPDFLREVEDALAKVSGK